MMYRKVYKLYTVVYTVYSLGSSYVEMKQEKGAGYWKITANLRIFYFLDWVSLHRYVGLSVCCCVVMTYIIVRETGTGTLVEGLSWPEFQTLSRTTDIETEQRDEANLRFVFDTDVTSLINILETLGKAK